MAESGRFPKPYVNSIIENDPQIVRVPMDRMDIGARGKGIPANPSTGPRGLDHVGGTAGGKR